MAKKLKGHANPLAELHFIANMPLEQAVTLIGDLANDTYSVILTEVDTNNFKFEIDDTRTHSRASKIDGTLQRWQGTETRVDVTGEVIRPFLGYQFFKFMFIGMCTMVIVGTGFMEMMWGYNTLTALLGACLLVFGVALFYRNHQEMQKEIKMPVHFRERDRLLQLIIDTFKSTAAIEAHEAITPDNIALTSDDERHKAKNL